MVQSPGFYGVLTTEFICFLIVVNESVTGLCSSSTVCPVHAQKNCVCQCGHMYMYTTCIHCVAVSVCIDSILNTSVDWNPNHMHFFPNTFLQTLLVPFTH